MNLKEGKISVKELALNITKLSCYDLELVFNIRSRMKKFPSDLSNDLVLECKGRCSTMTWIYQGWYYICDKYMIRRRKRQR